MEIPITLLFSDIRGSTTLGERMRPADFRTFLDRFYRLASDAIVAHDGIVDKVVGDEVIGLIFGGITGPRHAAAAVAAAIDLAERAAQASTTPEAAIQVGTAMHTGEAFVGATGLGTLRLPWGGMASPRQAISSAGHLDLASGHFRIFLRDHRDLCGYLI